MAAMILLLTRIQFERGQSPEEGGEPYQERQQPLHHDLG